MHLDAAVLRQLHLQVYQTVDSRALGKRRIGRIGAIGDPLQKIIRILSDAPAEGQLQAGDPVVQPIAAAVQWVGLRLGIRQGGRGPHRRRERNRGKPRFGQTLVEALGLFMHQRFAKGNLGVGVLQMDFAGRGSQFQRCAAAVQHRKAVHRPDSARGPLLDQMQSGIGLDVLLGAASHQRVDVCREVSRKIDDDVAGAGSK